MPRYANPVFHISSNHRKIIPKKVPAARTVKKPPICAGNEVAPEPDGLALALPVASARSLLVAPRGKTLATEAVTVPLCVVADIELLMVAFVVEYARE